LHLLHGGVQTALPPDTRAGRDVEDGHQGERPPLTGKSP
jgi:hypothetical protein